MCIRDRPEVNAGRKIKNLCYVEVNRESMLNVGEYTMKSDKAPFFDIASVFAANIRLSADDVPYVCLLYTSRIPMAVTVSAENLSPARLRMTRWIAVKRTSLKAMPNLY